MVTTHSDVTFQYHPLGRRIAKRVLRADDEDGDREPDEDEKGTPRVIRYLYDQEDIRATFTDSGRELARYTHGPGIDEPLGEVRKHRTRFYHADSLGSIIALTERHGHPVREYRYSAFGIPEDHRGDPQPYRYTGREWDKEVGLYYYRTRYYDPHSGRFLREDPLKGILRFPNTLNPYPYALGNPLIHADPSGMAPPAIAIAIAGGMIAGAINAAVKGEGPTGIASQAIMGGVAGLVGSNLASKAITSALAGGTVGAITDILGQIAANLARNGPVTDIDMSSVIRSFIAGAAGAGIGTYSKTLGLTEAEAQKVAAALGAVLSSSGNLLQRIIEAAEAATFCPLAP